MEIEIAHCTSSDKELFNYLNKPKKRRLRDIALIKEELKTLQDHLREFGFKYMHTKTKDITKIKGYPEKDLYRVRFSTISTAYRIICKPHRNSLMLLTVFKKKRGKIPKQYIILAEKMFKEHLKLKDKI